MYLYTEVMLFYVYMFKQLLSFIKGTKTKEILSTPESVKVEMKVNPKKNTELALRRNPSLKWSNGWSWEGDSFKAKVFLTVSICLEYFIYN